MKTFIDSNIKSLIIFLVLLTSCGTDGPSNDGHDSATFKTISAHWNGVAIDASGRDHSPGGAKENLGPTKSSRAMAIVHIAMFDAANAVSGQKYNPYLLRDVVSNASQKAAIAKAAYDTLTALFPSQTEIFRSQYQNDLIGISDGVIKERGIAVGTKAARLVLENRKNDGSEDLQQNVPYVFSDEPGAWRVDPINPTQKPLGANWDKVRPFVIESATQFRSPPPPPMTSARYAESFAEVQRLGGDGRGTPTERTQDQTEIGLYWAYDGTPSLCAPPRLYNQIALKVASDQGVTDNVEITRLLALVNIAMADAGITSWETKYYYNIWRPVTGVRESDPGTGPTGKGDGNELTFGDPEWSPLGAPASNLIANNFSPPFPAYVSGHATFGGALFGILRNFFRRDDVPFTFVSDELNGVTTDNLGNVRPLSPRTFKSFSHAEEENALSRIYLGVHWDFDVEEGTVMGNRVANYIFQNSLAQK